MSSSAHLANPKQIQLSTGMAKINTSQWILSIASKKDL